MGEDEREMLQSSLDKVISALKEGQYWTERRDAADSLAETAKQIVSAIEEVVGGEDDVDVRTGCEEALNSVRKHFKLQAVRTVTPPPPPARAPSKLAPESLAAAKKGPVPLADIIREDLAGPNVAVAETDDGYELVVKLDSGRFQTVYVSEEHDEKQGLDFIRIFTPCAHANSRAFKWALETNGKLMHGAIGIRQVSGTEMFVIADTYPTAMVSRARVRDAVFAIAETGDAVEKGMTRADRL